ncbi:MAG: hypothetical protein Kow00121_32150 [Elainellaceae cyanobacterium]
MRSILSHPWLHPGLLALWTVLGLGLRLLNLTEKPLWTDEFSTLVFSLGNSFLSVPLNQVLTADQLLQPLQVDPNAGIVSVVRHLLSQSNHPPLYFVLTHLWLKLFPTPDGWVSVWGARFLSVVFGTLSIPAAFMLGRFAFRSRIVGQIAAALMAVSPFGIYLAQEARHYTLAMLWIMASLVCLIAAAHTIRDRAPLPLWICSSWVIVNTLGIATHYLVMLALVAEAGVIALMGLVQSWREQGQWHPSSHWWRLVAVASGTGIGGLIWLPYLQDVQDSPLTEWIQFSNRSGWEWLAPIGQAIAAWISMLYLLPIQVPSQLVVTVSGIVLILLTLWTVPKVYWGLRLQAKQRGLRIAILALVSFVVSAMLLFFAVTYFLQRDLTSALRYNFVYFPAVIVLVSGGLATMWTQVLAVPPKSKLPGWLSTLHTGTIRTVILIGLLSLLGGITVAYNWGYQKTHRPDVVVQDIVQRSTGDVLVAIAHETHGQTGRLMGIAWELEQLNRSGKISNLQIQPRFLLIDLRQGERSVVRVLRQFLKDGPRPLDLWLVNFQDGLDEQADELLDRQNCEPAMKREATDGYRYRLYRCVATVKAVNS